MRFHINLNFESNKDKKNHVISIADILVPFEVCTSSLVLCFFDATVTDLYRYLNRAKIKFDI